jgi:predicted aldo/keto reductase-like oxidoreductase
MLLASLAQCRHFHPGGMSIGKKWNPMLGSVDKETATKILDMVLDVGNNFINIANNLYMSRTSPHVQGLYFSYTIAKAKYQRPRLENGQKIAVLPIATKVNIY